MISTTDTELKERVAAANLAAYDSAGVKDYIGGAPHIKHADLRRLYAELLVGVFQAAQRRTPVPHVLDLGAGEGSVTLPLLELGAHVTAVDISEDQLAGLRSKCLKYEDRLIVHCEDISLTLQRKEEKYDIIVANSFLHHIPDYLGMLQGLLPHLGPNGQFFSFQDPLLYSTQPLFGRVFEELAYASWRVQRGDVWNGLGRRLRRARGIYLPGSAHDNAEYHVVRLGVDQEAIASLFNNAECSCRIVPYFSTQSRFLQSIGTAVGFKNTFAVIAMKQDAICAR